MNQAIKNHAFSPRNLGVLPSPDGFAGPTGPCGESIELYLYIRDEKVLSAGFVPHGCAYTTACASVMTEMIEGLPLAEALDISPGDIEAALGELPPNHRHCLDLAVTTLREAVGDYYRRGRSPWKKLYAK